MIPAAALKIFSFKGLAIFSWIIFFANFVFNFKLDGRYLEGATLPKMQFASVTVGLVPPLE